MSAPPKFAREGLMLVGCKSCNKVTDRRCEGCGTVAYCSEACRKKDEAGHSPICSIAAQSKHKLVLDASNPFTQLQKDQPETYKELIDIVHSTKSDAEGMRDMVLLACKGQQGIKTCKWSEARSQVMDADMAKVIDESVRTRRPEQWNLLCLGYGGSDGFYHTRFSVQHPATTKRADS